MPAKRATAIESDDDVRARALAAGYRDREPDRRWISERLAEVDLRKSELAEKLHVHPNIVHKMLNGQRRVQIAEFRLLAQLLHVPFMEVVRRFGFDVPGAMVPCIGAIDGRARIAVLPPDRQHDTPAPESAVPGTVALIVDAPHSALSVYHGSTLYYVPSDTVRVDAFGRLGVLEIDGEPAPVVGVLDRATMGRGRVRVFGGIDVIDTERLVSATPVTWQRFG